MRGNLNIYFTLCNSVQLVASLQTSYSENINDEHNYIILFSLLFPVLCSTLLNILTPWAVFSSPKCFGCK